MAGNLLATARPYLQLFSLLSLAPPPGSFELSHYSWQWKLLMRGFGCYSCCILLLVFWVTYVNVMVLDLEIEELDVNDFTNALSLVQKIFYIVLIGTNCVYTLIYYHKLAGIYREISSLEQDIYAILQPFLTQRKRRNFRIYLFKRLGLWAIFLVAVLPQLTIPILADFMRWRDRILTGFVTTMMEFKGMEYTLFVLIIRELLRRLRYKLLHLQRELTTCNQREMLQALCLAMRRNKQLLARIWQLVGELEGYFMLPMLLLFLYNGVSMLHMVNWAYIQSVNPNDCCRFRRFGYLMLLLFNLLIACYVSHSCIKMYNSFGRILHNIRCGCGRVTPQSLTLVLMEYTLQLEHLKLRFTCGGFFDINLKTFGGIVVTIVSFTIILIQFKLQALLETKQTAKRRLSLKSNS